MNKFSLVLPCYNESRSLKQLVSRVHECAKRRSFTPEQFELVLVDNGSTDTTQEVLSEILDSPLGEYTRPLHILTNQGYGHGIFQGLQNANGNFLGWTHADEQCDPEDAFLAFEHVKENKDFLIKGTRKGRRFGEWLFSRAFEWVTTAMTGRFVHEINAQPKVFEKALLTQLREPPKDFAFDLYVLLQAKAAGLQIKTIPVKFPPRVHGESNWAHSFSSKWRTIKKMIHFMKEYRRSLPSRNEVSEPLKPNG